MEPLIVLEMLGLVVGLGFWVVVFIFCIWYFGRAYALEASALELINSYTAKLNGSNRFIFNEEQMKMVFPEYNKWVVKKVWNKLADSGKISRDPVDNEWCII